MSSPITFSGFNSIDFNTVLNLMMQQESVPRQTLAAQQTALKSKSTAFATLATKVSALASAADELSSSTSISGRVATSSDTSIVGATATSSAVPGVYDVTVTKLASAQVTAATTQQSDVDTTVVANGGTLTIGGKVVDMTDRTGTLEDLAAAINETEDIGVTATIISPSTGKYKLVLTATDSGVANAFSVVNNLTLDDEEPLIDFAGNAQEAADAVLSVNGIPITSASNTVSGAISGVTLQLHQKTGTSASTMVTIAKSSTTAETNVQSFVDAYNSLVTFIQAQGTDVNSLGRDPMLRSMWSQLRSTINSQYLADGAKTSLAVAGIGFDTTGKLSLDTSALSDALEASETGVLDLFTGTGTTDGAFTSISDLLDNYVGSGGLIYTTKTRLTEQVAMMDGQLANMDARLELRRAALQKQFTATDSLMSQLNSQAGALSNLGSGYSLF